MEKSQKKQTDKYSNQVYRPDVEVKFTGEEFMILQRILQDIRRERIGSVQVNVEGKVYQGQCLGGQDMDIEQLAAFIEQLHRKNVDNSLTIPIDVLRKELESAKKEYEKPIPQDSDETPENNVVAEDVKMTAEEKSYSEPHATLKLTKTSEAQVENSEVKTEKVEEKES